MRPHVSVLTTGHDLADARLHRLVRPLLARGLSVEVIGPGRSADAPSGTEVRPVRRRGLAARGVAALVEPWRAQGRVLLALDPDVIPAALLAGQVLRRQVVVDLSEDYEALLKDRAWASGAVGLLAHGVARAGTALARRADLTVVADAHVPPGDARRRLIVRNLPTGDYISEPAEPDPEPRAVYVGDVRTSRGLRSMLTLMEACPSWSLDIVGPVAKDDVAFVTEWRRASPATGRVRWHGRLLPSDAWKLATGAWVGLSLLEPTPAFIEAMPGKVYEYLFAGIPVVTSDLPRAAQLIRDSGAGRVVTDVSGAVAALQAWADDDADLLDRRAAARRWRESATAAAGEYEQFARAVAELCAAAPRQSAER